MRAELAWSRIMVKWVFIESLAGDSFGSGHSYYSGSFIFLGIRYVSGSGGIWEEAETWLIRIGGEEWVF